MTPIDLYEDDGAGAGAGDDEGSIVPGLIGAALGAVVIGAGVALVRGLKQDHDVQLAHQREMREAAGDDWALKRRFRRPSAPRARPAIPPTRDEQAEEWKRHRRQAVLAADVLRAQRLRHFERQGPSIAQLDGMLNRLGYNLKVDR